MDDLELLRLLRSRDQRGLDQLLVRHGPLLRYILCPILDDPREREECLSDVAPRYGRGQTSSTRSGVL